MPPNKTMLKMIEEESFHLIAIHCAREAYQIAFYLNKNLQLKLMRERKDIDFKHQEHIAYYPVFHHFDQISYSDFYLVANKFDGASNHAQSSGALFPEKPTLTSYLMPEYKKVDYFLKIEDDSELIDAQKVVNDLNKIPQIITAFQVNAATVKLRENLIFN